MSLLLETRVPSLPDISNVPAFLGAVKELLETREGIRGDPLDQNITFREAYQAGITAVIVGGQVYSRTGSGSSAHPILVEGDYTPPPALTNFIATGAIMSVILSWDKPPDTANVSFVEIWRASVNNIGVAVKVSTTEANVWSETFGSTGNTYYYWIRAVSRTNVPGPFNAVSGTQATTGYISNSDIIPDSTAPGAPTGLTTIGGLKYITLIWTRPADNDIQTFQIYRNSVNDRATATKIGDANTTIYPDPTTGSWYYWIRAVDSTGNIGAWNAVSGTLGSTVLITSGNIATYIGTAVIDDAYIVNLNVSKLLAGTISAGNIYLGDTTFELNGPNRLITIKDQQGSPVTRLKIGKVGAGSSDYGVEIYKADGTLLIGANGLGVSVVGQTNIALLAVDAARMANATITDAQIASLNVDKVSAGSINISWAGNIRSGQTAYNTGTGWFFGNVAGVPVFSMGDGGSNSINWGGTTLAIRGSLNADDIIAGTLSANRIGANTITAGKLSVSTLSSISADIGSITAGTLTGTLIQTSSSGKRIMINESSSNEARFYGDRGDGTVELLASIGINLVGSDYIIGNFGTLNSGNTRTAVRARSYSGAALIAQSSLAEGIKGSSDGGGIGVWGGSDTGVGVYAISASGDAIQAVSGTAFNLSLASNNSSTKGSMKMNARTNNSFPSSPEDGALVYLDANPDDTPSGGSNEGLWMYKRTTPTGSAHAWVRIV